MSQRRPPVPFVAEVVLQRRMPHPFVPEGVSWRHRSPPPSLAERLRQPYVAVGVSQRRMPHPFLAGEVLQRRPPVAFVDGVV